jgi:hypothetical protein
MKIKLTVGERAKLSDLLNLECGSFATIKLIRAAKEELSLSDDEIKKIKYVEIPIHDGGAQIVWEQKNDPNKECDFSDFVVIKITDRLKKMSDTGTLKDDACFVLFEKFVEGKK